MKLLILLLLSITTICIVRSVPTDLPPYDDELSEDNLGDEQEPRYGPDSEIISYEEFEPDGLVDEGADGQESRLYSGVGILFSPSLWFSNFIRVN
jgi:hypothetical protein